MKYYIRKHPLGESLFYIKEENINSYVPYDEANTDYQQYLEWVAEGNTAEEYQPE
jgi:hypothetical protein